MSKIGKNIRAMRVNRGMSQAELAERIGKRRSAVGNYENGTREPDLDTIAALADVFRVSISDLVGDAPADDTPQTNAPEAARFDPDRQALIDFARNGSSREVRQAMAIIHVIMRDKPDEFYEDK